MNSTRYKSHAACIIMSFLITLVICSCGDDDKEMIKYNDLQSTFHPDNISFDELPETDKNYILQLDESSASVTDRSNYSFRVNQLIQVSGTTGGDSIRITSYSAKTIYDVDVEVYLNELGIYLPVVHLDSIPGFSRFKFKPSFIGKRYVYETKDGMFVSFEYPYMDLNTAQTRLSSEDQHFKMLQKIDAQWYCYFSNFGAAVGSGYTNSQWLEMRPIFAREWIVILTNYAYMMTTPEYEHIMSHFSEAIGGDLYDNSGVTFTADDYQTVKENIKKSRTFVLGRTNAAYYGGLGGGTTFGISDWNFYGHYGSFSGWESIAHEFMHCFGYSHSSNMTYASNNVGWHIMIWQLHLYLSYKENGLPYLDRHLLDFTASENSEYRDNITPRSDFLDDAVLNNKRASYYKSSKLVKYLNEQFPTTNNE